jgi:hypothetical protein
MIRHKFVLTILAVFALLVLVVYAVQVRGISLGAILGAASGATKGDDITIATVNGEAVSLKSLERIKTVMQATSPTPLDDAEAYRKAMDHIVRNRVLIQEARRRGLTVSEQEARDYLAQIKAAAEQSPELAQMLKDQAKALGLDDHQFEERMVAAYREGLLLDKLYKALGEEAPAPSEEEVDIYLARQPGLNVLVLIPIPFADTEAAQAVYEELQSLAATQDRNQFTTTFDSYARRLGNRGPKEFVHETFRFADEEELPDYARDALDKPEGALGMLERSDGTAVIYLVLKSQAVSAAEARELARAHLAEEKRRAYVGAIEQQLVSQADVHIIKENLPPQAQSALGNQWK